MNKHGSFGIFMILVITGIVQSCPSVYPVFFRRPGSQVEIKLTTTIDTNSLRTYQISNGDTLYVSITFFRGIIADETEVNCPKANCELSGNVDNGNFLITLLDLQAAAAGTFQLREINNNVVISCSSLFILGPPTPPTVLSNKDPSVGASVIVTCRSASTTTPSNHGLRLSFNWTIFGQTNPADPRYAYSASRHQLTISNVRKTDSFIVMKCSATEDVIDGYTSESDPFALNVVYIACTSDCWPRCINKWYNDTTNVIITKTGTMSLGKPQRSQTGNYTCVAENIDAEYNKRTSTTLGIIVHYPPEVHVDSKNASSDDKVAILKCIAKGVPDHYTYNNWEQRWIGSNLVRNWPSKGLPSLILEDLTYEHSGVYTCSASNGVPRFPNRINNTESSAYIFIKDVPVVLSPTLSKEEILVVLSKLGDTIYVNITVFSNVGGFEASVERTYGSFHPNTISSVISEKKVMLPVFGTLIEEDGYSVDIVIITENEQDFSYYTVRIKNDFKQTTLLIDVRAEGPPTIPTQFTVSKITQNAIETSWFAEFNGGFRQTFVIQISIDEHHWSNASIRIEDIDTLSKIYRHTINNLDHSTKYFLRLYAFNELGTSGFTSALQATTIDTQEMQALDQGLSSPGRSIPVRITNECTEHVLPQLYHESSSTGTVTSGVFGGVVGGVVALAVVVVAVLIISRKYRISCLKPSDSERNTKIQSNPVFETQTASPYEHLNTREKTEYTEIGMTAVGQSGVGSPNNETSSYERLHTRENAAFTELGVSPPESQTQFESQQTDSHTASSNYEVPDNQEPSKEPKDYGNGTNPKKTQASTYTAPLEHQYTALGAKR
ncbi:uncharacterized protein LOC128233436 isoform X2 [Mya arenaria]|uniref:uncharacterized protein LOC128233436 isoform X2 n=1 Tax=Mya arenaria TaxID=6604 RepID=UPI0022E83A67|nr:uncharacterized protein LOC128233436 isoform X2 [Mya arenaria]